MVVLVTGGQGQLGQAIQSIASNYKNIQFVFYDSKALDISSIESVKNSFAKHKPQFCINAAAYTAVDLAETETKSAYLINVVGVQNLANVCKENDTILFHISTDFVFDGNTDIPYTENDLPNPTGVYGKTKLDGEKVLWQIWHKHIIVRTSWVYSQFGKNFMKTMLRLASEKTSLSVVNDQIGTPTYAVDLAEAIVKMICKIENELSIFEEQSTNIYNFSNEGQCSWFEFAKKIFEVHNIQIDLIAIPSTDYPTPAKRPSFSVLDKTKIKNKFDLQILTWEDALEKTKVQFR